MTDITSGVIDVQKWKSVATKKVNYIDLELEWLEKKAEELKTYCDLKPINELEDRVQFKETRNGGVIPMVVATIEQQIKSQRETLQDYIKIIEAISKLRETEAAKKTQTRGDQELSPLEERGI